MSARIPWRQYRIVRDNYNGFEAQFRTWYWPFWRMVDFCNTNVSVESARTLCDIHARSVVEYYKPNSGVGGTGVAP